MHSHRIEDSQHALDLMLAGNARFTLVSPKTGTRFTYRVRQSKDGAVHFISLLNGPSNETDYLYLGIIGRDGLPHLTGKSHVGSDAPSWKAISFTLAHLRSGNLPVEFWHEGRCCRCGRPLTVPGSIAAGIGPECANHV